MLAVSAPAIRALSSQLIILLSQQRVDRARSMAEARRNSGSSRGGSLFPADVAMRCLAALSSAAHHGVPSAATWQRAEARLVDQQAIALRQLAGADRGLGAEEVDEGEMQGQLRARRDSFVSGVVLPFLEAFARLARFAEPYARTLSRMCASADRPAA